MKKMEYLYGGLVALALILMYLAFQQYRKTQALISTGIKTTATVIDLIENRDSDGSTYKPVFEYFDRQENRIEYKSSIGSSPPSYQIGEKVEIVYSKDGEDRKVVSFWGLYRWTIILLMFAAPMLIVGGGYFLYVRG